MRLQIAISLALAWACNASAQTYDLSPGEVVDVQIYGHTDLSGRRSLGPDGNIALPLAGRIKADGQSPEELETSIAMRLEETGLSQDPSVSVSVIQRNDIFVDGDVNAPGAYGWRPGLTVRQVVALAGGRRVVETSQLSNVLQAFQAEEDYKALRITRLDLLAREARLLGEIAFAETVFGETRTSDLVTLTSLSPDVGEDPEGTGDAARPSLAFVRDLRAKAGRGELDLIVFPEDVATDTDLAAIRATQDALIRSRVRINLAQYDSVTIQLRSLQEAKSALEQRLPLIEADLARLRERADGMLRLRESGLARVGDVVNMQTALTQAITARLETIRAIAETDNQIEALDLQLRNFGTGLQREAANELTEVRRTLAEVEVRMVPARRAAALAASYQSEVPQQGTASGGMVRTIMRYADGAVTELPAEANTLVWPGDTVVLSLAID